MFILHRPPARKDAQEDPMKAAGIIAEYNPLHNGHAYQLAQARKETGADFIVTAMSGDFLQRGAPAVTDKYTRAQMALLAGADLVLEIPALWSVSSAEYYARAGVSCLAATGAVDCVCYGCESIRPRLLAALTAALTGPNPTYHTSLTKYLREGKSYPLARQEALCIALPGFDGEEIRSFLSSPNNILALEYEKAIAGWNKTHAKAVRGHAIQRLGDGYHSPHIQSGYASATAIRQKLFAADGSLLTDGSTWETLSGCLPQTSLSLLRNAAERGLLMDTDDFSGALYAALLADRDGGYTRYADATEAISRRIGRHLSEFVSFTQFAGLLKTKELTYTRIMRVLTHIMLGFTQEDMDTAVPYLRVLGFRKNAAPLLTAIRKKASVPLVTKVADASQTLSKAARSDTAPNGVHAMRILQADIRAADLYRGICSIKSGCSLRNEYNQPLVIVP